MAYLGNRLLLIESELLNPDIKRYEVVLNRHVDLTVATRAATAFKASCHVEHVFVNDSNSQSGVLHTLLRVSSAHIPPSESASQG